jgi:hypothetical protein
MSRRAASSSIADSSAKMPGPSCDARIGVGTTVLTETTWWSVSIAGQSYIDPLQAAAISTCSA